MTLKELLKERNLSVSTIAQRSGLPYTTVSELVNGKKSLERCSLVTAVRLSHALCLSAEELLLTVYPSSFPDKYSLSLKENLFLAKKKWDENVYCGIRMENRAVTFPETQTILSGINVPHVSLSDIEAILNMRDAWRHMLSTMEDPLDLEYLCELNSYIARNEALEWGKLRTGNVGITGTDYLPPVPNERECEEKINAILNGIGSATEKALDLFCFITRSQLFWDGNKRTALAAANKLLVSRGKGMLTIPEKKMEEFNKRLLSFYETGYEEELKVFLYENAIQGIDYPQGEI